MTGQEAQAYIWSLGWERHVPGLTRIRALMERLGNPQKRLRFLHVAGTNGKGSVCACLASVLTAAGYRVGLNTSPHLERFHERIQVDGVPIPDEALGRLTEEVQKAAERMPEAPTEFEVITAIAFLYFLQEKCQIVILETGLGGALDASNVIDTPDAAVLTAMGIDHGAILGRTQKEIAQAKAGIIKPGGTVVSMGGCQEADAVFRTVCRERGAELIELDRSRLSRPELSLEGSRFSFSPYTDLRISLAGCCQAVNAATAITTLEALGRKGWRISSEALRKGLSSVRWPGRFEALGRNPTVILDGAHNPQGIAAAAESFRTLCPGRKAVLLLGILADKAAEEMLDPLIPLASKAVVLRPESPRALDPLTLCDLLKARGIPAKPAVTPEEGVQEALREAGPGGMVLCLGSLYLVGQVRPLLLC